MGKGVAMILAGLDHQAHEVIILCRSHTLGEAVKAELTQMTSNHKISIILCDLTRLADVKRAITEIHAGHDYLDGIFINAGIGYAATRVETEDGMDSHFQVNYLSQFMLTLNLLDLLYKSTQGGRVIFNVTRTGEINWDDLQMKKGWKFETCVHQAMVAKRMLLVKLHDLHRNRQNAQLSFVGFEISKPVWSNQLNIIPFFMRAMATLMKAFGSFYSIRQCGEIMAPLFTENRPESLNRSGKLITWKKNTFSELQEDATVLDKELQDRLWNISLDLCGDEKMKERF